MISVNTTIKYAVVAGVSALTWIFFVAGAATPHTTSNAFGRKTEIGYTKIRLCAGGTCASSSIGDALPSGCGGFKSGSDAALAFAILAILAISAAIALAVVIIVLRIEKLKIAVPACAAAAMLCSLIAWPIGFALHSSIKCQGSTLSASPDSKVGASAPLLLIGWLLTFAVGGAWFVLKETDGGSSANAGENKTAADAPKTINPVTVHVEKQ